MKSCLTLFLAAIPLAAAILAPPQPPTPFEGRDDQAPQFNESTPGCSNDFLDSMGRNGLSNDYFRWKTLKVLIDPYQFSDYERRLINDALYRLGQVVYCLYIFIYQKGTTQGQGDYVKVIRQGPYRCASRVGRQGGEQLLWLGENCMDEGTIQHEFIHALGFDHEQCSPNRDQHVRVFWQNIGIDNRHNFYKLEYYEASVYNVPYNTHSVMHYRSRDFSINNGPTILDLNNNWVGTTGSMQNTDKRKLQLMYGCCSRPGSC